NRRCLPDISSTIPAQIYDVEATRIDSDFEVNSARCSGFGKGNDNRGHIRIHARPTTRALREGAIGSNVAARRNARGYVVLARWYVQVGCDLRSVRRRHDHSVVTA